MMTSTARNTPDPSTAGATGRRRPAGKSPRRAPRVVGEVARGVERDLEELAARDKQLSAGLAATARALAAKLDDPGNSATSASMCARALLEVMSRLWEHAPAQEEADRLDDLAAQRKRRVSAAKD